MMNEKVTAQPSQTVELPEVTVLPGKQDSSKPADRPVSARSVSSTSVSTTRAKSIYLSKYTINSYYSYREGAFERAVSDCTTHAVTPEDGEVLGSWMLTEIDQWDCDQETVVLLTDNSVVVARYDFVKNSIYTHKKWSLRDITTVKTGDFVYPALSLMPERDYGGVRLICGNEADAGFFARWNFGGARSMPYWTFAHHKLIYLEGQQDNARYNVDDFHDALVHQTNLVYSTLQLSPTLHDLHDKITIYSYASLTSTIFNQSALGFSKDRSGINY